MARIIATITKNDLPMLAARFPELVNRGVRKQVFVSEADIKTNIVKYGYIDTGAALGSTRGEMTGQTEGQVSISAESGSGFPYPWIGNYGGVHISPRPFFSDAEAKAESEFAGRVADEINGALR